MLNFNADPTAAESQGSGGFHVVGDGTWEAEIIMCDYKATKKGPNALFTRFQVTDDKGTGLVFNCFNIEHPSEKVREIGHRELSALCVAVGIDNLTDPSQLLAKRVKVTIQADKEGEPRIRRYDKAADAPAPTQANAINDIADSTPF